jgi:hypothetical protein
VHQSRYSGKYEAMAWMQGLGVCAVESIPTAKAPQRSIFLFFFVA